MGQVQKFFGLIKKQFEWLKNYLERSIIIFDQLKDQELNTNFFLNTNYFTKKIFTATFPQMFQKQGNARIVNGFDTMEVLPYQLSLTRIIIEIKDDDTEVKIVS